MGCFVVDKGMFNKNGEPITALGYYHKDLNHVKSLTSIEEELDLLSRYREFRDPEAKRLLVEAHLLMVVRMAWKFSRFDWEWKSWAVGGYRGICKYHSIRIQLFYFCQNIYQASDDK